MKILSIKTFYLENKEWVKVIFNNEEKNIEENISENSFIRAEEIL